jgi:hypothetical protein
MHNFPNNIDPNVLSNAMARVELNSEGSARHSPSLNSPHATQPDEFPDLLATRLGRATRFDPSRNRFANAVKRVNPIPNLQSTQITGARQNPLPLPSLSSATIDPRTTALAVPRPSQRIKLHPPTLLPTLQTGTIANEQYMAARATAIRLGHARNACLARAADAFRRGDGAAAKRFSREGKSLNERMLNETNEAALGLVKERMEDARRGVRERDASWSDDPLDRNWRGKDCGGGLGVILGVARKGTDRSGSEERVECLLDLHTLHGNEGGEVLGMFLGEVSHLQ